MDGLELSQIVRSRLPAIKIVILSGHDKFDYAQRAIKLGVSEYLLKPITVQDMHAVLEKIAAELAQEHDEQLALAKLQGQVQENRAALSERFLLELATGAVASAEALEKSRLLGLDLIARCYLIAVIRVESADAAQPFDYHRRQQAQQAASGCLAGDPDAFLVKKDLAEWVLILKGDSPERLCAQRDRIIGEITEAVEGNGCTLIVGSGAPQVRISELYQSFTEASANVQAAASGHGADLTDRFDKTELLKIDRSAVEDYLRFGTVAGFDAFFDAVIHPLGEVALRSAVVNNYILMDVVLAAAKFVDELEGNVYQIIPGLNHIESILADIETPTQVRDQVGNVLIGALVFRDKRAIQQYAGVIRQAEDYIEHHFADPNLSLNDVATQVSLSPSHFSAVFSQETGQTFKERLTEARIKKAKELTSNDDITQLRDQRPGRL